MDEKMKWEQYKKDAEEIKKMLAWLLKSKEIKAETRNVGKQRQCYFLLF